MKKPLERKEVFIIESNGGADSFGWYPVFMYNTVEQAVMAIKPLLKRWPDAYRIARYVPADLQEFEVRYE